MQPISLEAKARLPRHRLLEGRCPFDGLPCQLLHVQRCRAPSATTGAMAQTAAGQPPGVPGAQTVRTQGNPQPVAPLQADPVGPASKSFLSTSTFQLACMMAFIHVAAKYQSWRHIWRAEGLWRVQTLLRDQAGVPQILRRFRKGAGAHLPPEPCCTA